jgi:hypothetical protein
VHVSALAGAAILPRAVRRDPVRRARCKGLARGTRPSHVVLGHSLRGHACMDVDGFRRASPRRRPRRPRPDSLRLRLARVRARRGRRRGRHGRSFPRMRGARDGEAGRHVAAVGLRRVGERRSAAPRAAAPAEAGAAARPHARASRSPRRRPSRSAPSCSSRWPGARGDAAVALRRRRPERRPPFQLFFAPCAIHLRISSRVGTSRTPELYGMPTPHCCPISGSIVGQSDANWHWSSSILCIR